MLYVTRVVSSCKIWFGSMRMSATSSAQHMPGPAETALYTKAMLESLKVIALRQQQPLLAHLLDLAAMEAKSLGEAPQRDTLLPG